MSVFTLVMTVDVEAVSFAGYFYFHTDINVGDLIDVEMEKAPGGVFNGRVTEAYSLGMKDDAAEVPPCRRAVLLSWHPRRQLCLFTSKHHMPPFHAHSGELPRISALTTS